jgi:hypothetical protein
MATNSDSSISKLILVPSIITLAITALRLVGELQHWPTSLFNPAAGGGGALIGISYLPPILGIYFARKLVNNGESPASAGKVILYAAIGFVVMLAGIAMWAAPQINFPGKFIVGGVLLIASAVLQLPTWRKLFNVLGAYALAARIPVTILMFFAIKGNWGTHYDVAPPNFPETDWFTKFIQIGFMPQMFFWTAFTIITGALTAGITAAIVERGKSKATTATT